MGKFFITKIWLEDREIELLKEHDFTEEVAQKDIDIEKRWILTDLCMKGFLHTTDGPYGRYYQEAGGYLQHFT